MKTRNTFLGGLCMLFLFFATTSVNQAAIAGAPDSKVVKSDRNVSGFNSIDVSGAFHVYITQGNDESLTVEADEDVMDDIKTEVKGGRLKIYMDKNYYHDVDVLNIYLTFKSLNYIELSGAVQLEGQNACEFNEMKLDISGAADMKMDLSFEKMDADLSGASELDLKGSGGSAYVEASGASKVDMEDLAIKELTLDVSGASVMKVNATSVLKIEASGASSVRYTGGASVKTNTSGASSVRSF